MRHPDNFDDFGKGEYAPLRVEIDGGKITISIGVETLAFATIDCNEDLAHFEVDLAEGFAKDVLNELTREEEDGSTIITRMFDAGAAEAVEQGSEYITETDDIDEDEQEPPEDYFDGRA